MDAQVPAVVAVVVTTGPGPWLEEALSSLAAQDYGELSVLVLSTVEDDPGLTERVAGVLPDAFVRQLPGRPGYAAASIARTSARFPIFSPMDRPSCWRPGPPSRIDDLINKL